MTTGSRTTNLPAGRTKGRTSSFLGVSWSRQNKKWQVQLKVAGKTRHVGVYQSEEAAAMAWDEAAVAVRGEGCRTNFTAADRAATHISVPRWVNDAKVKAAAPPLPLPLPLPRFAHHATAPPLMLGQPTMAWDLGISAVPQPVIALRSPRSVAAAKQGSVASPAAMPHIAYEAPAYMNVMRPEDFENRLEILWFVALSESARHYAAPGRAPLV